VIKKLKIKIKNYVLSACIQLLSFRGFYNFFYRTLVACSQREGGLAQGGLTQMFKRAINVQFRTKFSAGLLPPLRQTARWLLCILSACQVVSFSHLCYLLGTP